MIHLVTSTRYGYFRDALYYLACSEHLDWGYVDHPPLIVVIAWVTRHTLGTSLPALIFWPALAGVGRILLVADSVKKGYDRVEIAATLDNPYAMPNETRPILLCRGRHGNLVNDWPSLKRWR